MKISLYYASLAALTFAMIIFTVFTGSQAVPNGQALRSLEKEKSALALQERELQHQLSQTSSLTSSQQLAEAQGYAFTNSIIHLSTQTQVALR